MRRSVYGALLAVTLLLSAATAHTFAQRQSRTLSAQDVLVHSFSLLNASMKSGDFSDLAAVYTPDATLTRSTPAGKTTVYHGLAAILGFYKTLPTLAPGFQWQTQSMRSLAPDIVLAYEKSGTPTMAQLSRCFHVVRVENGLIQSYGWVVYFPDQK
jgi:hypothetical protein